MTPADRRITELIDKWLTSIELHLQYTELSDAAYARVQPWQKHDRPTRWVLEVARQKVLELKQHCETRQAMGDSKFSESLELMAFLANLVGIQHIQRFIPLADPAKADSAASVVHSSAPTSYRKTGTDSSGVPGVCATCSRIAEFATRTRPQSSLSRFSTLRTSSWSSTASSRTGIACRTDAIVECDQGSRQRFRSRISPRWRRRHSVVRIRRSNADCWSATRSACAGGELSAPGSSDRPLNRISSGSNALRGT